MTRTPLNLALALALAVGPTAAVAQVAGDPAAAQIEAFDASLLDVLKQSKGLSAERRAQKLQPAIAKAFDLKAMTRFAVGPSWAMIPAAEQQALIEAFTRMTVATYAHNFNGYSGERFAVEKVDTRGPDKLVHTKLTSTGSAPVTLIYRMRQSGGTWKVIDVYYNGAISSLTGQRSEFSATLRTGGPAALVKKLDAQAVDLLKR